MGRTAYIEPQCLYKGALYLLTPWSRKSRAIPLLPLCAVRPIQSLSACTRVHFTFYCRGQERVELYLYSPYVPYGLYRASVPVQGCTLPSSAVVKKEYSYTSTPLWAVRPVLSLSACTRVHFTYFTFHMKSIVRLLDSNMKYFCSSTTV